MRGAVIALTAEETILRARRMANHRGATRFDPALPEAPAGYYRLPDHNGGTDPTAADHFSRWTKPGKTHVNVTSDCVGLAAWASGFDRYQPIRGRHLQGGWINCDFMVRDALGAGLCFERRPRPEPGCLVVYPSLADQDDDGERDGAGHVGVVIAAPAEWDATELDSWLRLVVIDCASRSPDLSDQYTTGRVWFGSRVGEAGRKVPKGSLFVRSVMRP